MIDRNGIGVAGDVCADAAKVVTTERENQHGSSVACHNLIAQFWSDYLGEHVTAYDVAQMMVLMKVARARMGDPRHRDHYVDQAGYSGLAYQMAMEISEVSRHERTSQATTETGRDWYERTQYAFPEPGSHGGGRPTGEETAGPAPG